MLRIGLTGGIACGKSRVRRRLAAAGFATLDLDAVAHEVIAPGGAAYGEVVAAFGRDILAPDGTVDRKALGTRVFADAEARAQLNALVHPRVREEEARRAAAAEAAGARAFVTDAALLVEAGLHLRFDRLLVVDCEGTEQLRRLVARDGLDEASARARIAAQMPAGEKRRYAHLALDASGTLQDTDAATDVVVADLARLADQPRRLFALRAEAVVAAALAGPARGPRGLDPARWLAEVAAAGGVEMERLARLLVPPPDSPWYAAGDAPGAPDPGPEALALLVGLWSVARGGFDPPLTAGAMFSIARLTHRDPDRIAGACLLALAAAEVGARLPADEDARRASVRTAERWAAGTVPTAALAVVEAARRHPEDERAAAEAVRAAGGDPALARGLVAAGLAVPPADAPPQLAEAARALLR